MKKKILVTGASGFIGRRLVRHLVNYVDKKQILCLVHKNSNNHLEQSGRKNLKDLGLDFLPVELVSGWGLDKVPKYPKLVFHLAALTDTSIKDQSVNDVGTKNLLEAIGPLGKDSHFVYTSSIALNDNRKNYSAPIDESTPPPERPCSEYGRKKLKTEHYLIKKSKEQGFGLSIVRVSCVYGKGARRGGLFDGTHKMVLDGSSVVRLNWPGKMSLINVDDMAEYLIKVSQIKPDSIKNSLYIPSVEVLSLSDISRIMHKSCGLKYSPINLPKFFWRFCAYVAKHKRMAEIVLPHKVYNKFWQACILSNHEYWNEPKNNGKIFKGWKPITFEEYFNELVKEQTK